MTEIRKKGHLSFRIFLNAGVRSMTQFSSTEEIFQAVGDMDIEFVRLQFTDMNGVFRDTEIGTDALDAVFRKGLSIDNRIDDGSRMPGTDLIIKPDPRTFSIIPWKENLGVSARLICEICTPDGSPYEGCTRSALKKTVRRMFQNGYTMQVTPTIGFFLFDMKDGAPDAAPAGSGSFCGSEPAGKAEDVRRNIFRALKKFDIDVASTRHGTAPGQYEFVLKKTSALRAADNIMTFKYIVKTVARLHGLHASFMPKPFSGIPGSGMPLAVSLFKSDDNVFFRSDADMMLSPEARAFVGGLLSHARGLSLVTNPTVNSYKRLISDADAPLNISWSGDDINSYVRVPSARGKSTRIEVRCPDPSCNPYSAISLIAACGLDGVEKGTDPGVPAAIGSGAGSVRLKNSVSRLPTSLSEAVSAFSEDAFVRDALGADISESLIRKASCEWDEYCACVHRWEIDKYLRSL